MHMKKAVIFDLDGTLANTLTSLAYSHEPGAGGFWTAGDPTGML